MGDQSVSKPSYQAVDYSTSSLPRTEQWRRLQIPGIGHQWLLLLLPLETCLWPRLPSPSPSSPIPRTSRGAPRGLDPLDGEVREPLGDGDAREGGRLHPTGEEPIPASPPGYGRTTPGSPSSRYLHHRHHPPRRLHSSSPRGFGASVKSLPCLGGADGEAPTGWGDGQSVHGGPA